MQQTINQNQILNTFEQYRNLELIQETSIYTIQIRVKKGRKSKSLKWEYLGLPKEQVRALEKYGNTPGSIRLVEVIENECKQGEEGPKGAPRLNKLINKLKNDYLVYFAPHYFFAESQVKEITDLLNQIFAEEERIRNKVEECYEKEYKCAAFRIRESIRYNPNLTQEEIKQIVAKYISYYPTKEELLNGFGIEIEHIEKIPSILEQGQKHLGIAEQNQKKQELKNIADLQEEYYQNIKTKLGSATDKVVAEAMELMDKHLSKIDDLRKEGKTLQSRAKKGLREAVDRINRLANFNSSLKTIAEDFAAYSQKEISGNFDGLTFLDKELNGVREQLKADMKNISNENNHGHKRIAQWLD